MSDSKVILIVEIDVVSDHSKEVTAHLQSVHDIALAHPGCELFLQTTVEDELNKIRLLEVFGTPESHQAFMGLDSTKEVFSFLQGKLASPPRVTRLRNI